MIDQDQDILFSGITQEMRDAIQASYECLVLIKAYDYHLTDDDWDVECLGMYDSKQLVVITIPCTAKGFPKNRALQTVVRMGYGTAMVEL
ncbi:hypothetical protein C0995_009440 [Termitomyces sp. Mi166|nr:hypothetical protein C0995_009440 [Termitomyces sp. Mi166\